MLPDYDRLFLSFLLMFALLGCDRAWAYPSCGTARIVALTGGFECEYVEKKGSCDVQWCTLQKQGEADLWTVVTCHIHGAHPQGDKYCRDGDLLVLPTWKWEETCAVTVADMEAKKRRESNAERKKQAIKTILQRGMVKPEVKN